MSGLTDAQRRALKWLHNRGGSGMFTHGQVLLASGELAGVMRATWNRLAQANPPAVTIEKKRCQITETGKAVAMNWLGNEAETVWDDE